jgi:molybdopterin converting factor subunit 1
VNVRVRMFALLKQTIGSDHVDVELPEGATVGILRRRLAERFPQRSNLIGLVMFAVDMQYADDATPLAPGADVACIPPVSGG